MKFKKAMKIVKKLDSVAQLSMKAKITMLEELTGIEDGETLTKEILAQGVTLENSKSIIGLFVLFSISVEFASI